MNDDIREKLSAYLDGALSDADRRAVEVEVDRSEELRRELEALRAVSAAVKGLPKEKLPDGFAARLESRRAREAAAPAREYFVLPPSYRPLALALSSAVVALVIWDRTVTRPDPVVPSGGWDSEKIAVKSAAEAPASIDVSGQLSSLSASAESAADEIAKKEDAGAAAGGAASTFGKKFNAPGKPLEVAEADASPSRARAGAAARRSARSPPPPPPPPRTRSKGPPRTARFSRAAKKSAPPSTSVCTRASRKRRSAWASPRSWTRTRRSRTCPPAGASS